MAAGAPRSTFEASLSNFMSEHDTGSTPAATFDPGDPDAPAHAIPQGTLDFAHALNQSWGLAAPDTDELFGLPYAGDPWAPPLLVRHGSVVDIPVGSALETAYGGSSNLSAVIPANQRGQGDTLDRSWTAN